MIDVKVIHAKNLAVLTSITLLSKEEIAKFLGLKADEVLTSFVGTTAVPELLDIRGQGLSNTTSVLVNRIQSPGFTVLDSGRIYAVIPTELSNGYITSVDVYTDIQGASNSTEYSFELTDSLGFVQGKQKLIAQFIKCLYTTRGSDWFAPNEGVGLHKWLGKAVASPEQLSTDIAARIYAAARMITDSQTAARTVNRINIPASERLLQVQIQSISVSEVDSTGVDVEVALVTYDGVTTITNLFASAIK